MAMTTKTSALIAAGVLLGLPAHAYGADVTAGTSFQDCATCPEMIVVGPGQFVMGSPDDEPERDADESPRHTVTISAPFAVSRFEITRGQFSDFVDATGHTPENQCRVWVGHEWQERDGHDWTDPLFAQTDAHPVVCITWHDAKAYVTWMAETTGHPYRLLTEAEWEYAARGGTTTVYHTGNDPNGLCAYENGHDQTSMDAHPDMNWVGIACRDGFAETAPVGSLKPNPFGLHDVHGNVWEWLEDCYTPSYANAPADGSASITGACEQRVYRGGGWSVQKRGRRAANRGRFDPDGRYGQLGLRVARDLK